MSQGLCRKEQTRGRWLTHGFVRFITLPFHSSSAAYSQSSSSVAPFAAGIHQAPLCTFSSTTVAHTSEYKRPSHKWVHHLYRIVLLIVLISGAVVQTLVADLDSCSLKLCSNCSLLRTSACFS